MRIKSVSIVESEPPSYTLEIRTEYFVFNEVRVWYENGVLWNIQFPPVRAGDYDLFGSVDFAEETARHEFLAELTGPFEKEIKESKNA